MSTNDRNMPKKGSISLTQHTKEMASSNAQNPLILSLRNKLTLNQRDQQKKKLTIDQHPHNSPFTSTQLR